MTKQSPNSPLQSNGPGGGPTVLFWRRFADRWLKAMGWISAIFLASMMVLTFVDVVGRYVFNKPIFGSIEMIQFMLAITVFSGLALVNADDSHVTVELFDTQVKKAFPRFQPFLVQGVSLCVMGLIVVEMFQTAIHSYQLGSDTIVLQWPLWIPTFSISVLAAISFVIQISSLIIPHDDTRHDMDELL